MVWGLITSAHKNLELFKSYDAPPAVFIPSSMVKTAPHFGHFTLASLPTYPAQPKEKAAKTTNAKTMLIHFFTPLHLLSFGRYLSINHGNEKRPLRQKKDTSRRAEKYPYSWL